MTLAAVLLLGAVLIGAFMPKVLRRFESTTLAPAAILAAWIGSIVGLGFLAVSAVVILLWPSHAPAEGLSEALVRCFTAFQHAMAPWIGEALAVGGVAVTALIAVRSLFLAHRQHKAEPRSATTTVMSYRSSPAQIRHRMTFSGLIIRCRWPTASLDGRDSS